MNLMTIQIKKVESKSELKKFIHLPWQIYRNDPNWVPPLLAEEKEQFDRNKFPFFKHSEAEFFLALRQNKPVGRIAAIINNNHNKFHDEKTGFFGFFECIDEQKAADGLFAAAKEYVKSKGMNILRGPMNYSTNDTCGVLVKGFDTPPFVMMPHNPAYYSKLIENGGFIKTKDLFAYYLTNRIFSKRVVDAAKKIAKRYNVKVRNADIKNLDNEIEKVRKIYNSAWGKNWGFVPMTNEEFDFMAKKLRHVLDPRICLFAEIEDETVGFSLALPNWNQVLITMNGRLFPLGIFKLLFGKKKINQLRVITMGVIEEHRRKAIDVLLNVRMLEEGVPAGMPEGEMSWILEDNAAMNKGLQTLGADPYKTYRIYDLKL